MKVYQAKVVKEINDFYGELLYELQQFSNIVDHLEALANRMYEGVKTGVECIFTEINNYHKDYLGKPTEQLQILNLTLEDCKMAIANEYGFIDWKALVQLGQIAYNIPFEQAVNAILSGDLIQLKILLRQNPNLIDQYSQYGHAATLLNYVASNGIEFWRQKVPLNLVEITEYLLVCGADRDATMNVYGGKFDTLSLISTSAHPKQAGVLKGMETLLT